VDRVTGIDAGEIRHQNHDDEQHSALHSGSVRW
jgi:hypothetical protein